ncbi:MAG: cytochrome c oxidase subunit 3 [Acetobacteraceae bacterium]|nr:cytochrome c oxidase subunit 3 [Acetobacteraceae bacterium]
MAEPKGFQYASPAHEADTAIAGMWLFLASEALFFGGLFFVWLQLRIRHTGGVTLGAEHANLLIGTLNTAILLTSSLSYTLGVQRAREGRGRATAWAALVTAGLGVAFLGLKLLEWGLDLRDGLFPGVHFALTGQNAGGAHLFYDLYWVATGLHGAHMLVGIGLVLLIARRAWQGEFSPAYTTPVEVTGLYWSFVDVIWIILYALIYVVGRA